ncbi:MAG: HBS1-like protein [Marteilia pararefringens]
MPVGIEGLPEIKPQSDPNLAQLVRLRVQKACIEAGHCYANTQLCITGHVDSGKTSLTANLMKHCGVLQEKSLKEEENRIIARKGEDYKPTQLEIATRSMEKGKEAKDRGMTIEVRAHELPLTLTAVFKVDSAEWNEMIELLTFLGRSYEIIDHVDANGNHCKAIRHHDRLIICDAPGHSDFITATSSTIAVADWQHALFPSSSGSGEQAEDPFIASLNKGSTSMGHSRLGVSRGNYMTFVLSKGDTNSSEGNAEKDAALRRVLAKTMGIKPNKQIVIPSSSKDMKAHNIFTPSDLDCFKYYKGQEVDLSVKDYRDPSRVYPLKVHIQTAMDLFPYILPQVCVKGTFNNRGTLIFITDIASKTNHGVITIGQVLNGVVSVGDIVTSTQNPDCQYRVETIEEFLKPVQKSPVKAFIGMKLKVMSKNKTQAPRHDLLHASFPTDNIPVTSQYMEAKMLFFPTDTPTKAKECKLGIEFTMVTVMKATISIVNVFSYKPAKQEEVKDTPDSPITAWPQSNTLVHGIVKFKQPLNLPHMDQAVYGNQGNFLSSKQVAGSIKLISHIKDGESKDKPLLAQKSKKKPSTGR